MFNDFYDIHLNREGYFLFAEEVVEEIYRVIGVVCSRQVQQIKFPSCMIPPVFKSKGAKGEGPSQVFARQRGEVQIY